MTFCSSGGPIHPAVQVVLLDSVVEGVDHPVEGVPASGPLVQRRMLAHDLTASPAAGRPDSRGAVGLTGARRLCGGGWI
jgi:hypothetical protein